MAISLGAILNTYQTHERLSPEDYASNEYWLFKDGDTNIYKRRNCIDVNFYMQLFNDVIFEDHSWSVVGNYYNIKVKPYMLREDFEKFSADNDYLYKFNFESLLDNANTVEYAGDYVYWPRLSARFFGWTLYLLLNFGIRLDPMIPLPCNRRLGPVNLLTNNKVNLDTGATFLINDYPLFCNGPFLRNDCKHAVIEVDYRCDENTIQKAHVLFSAKYVGVKNQVILNYLVNNDNVVACRFTEEYSHLGKIDLKKLRISNYEEQTDHEPMELDETVAVTNEMFEIKVSPSSLFNLQFEHNIRNCLAIINEYMSEAMPNHNCGNNFLKEYMDMNEYTTLPYLVINVWIYCKKQMNLKIYQLEDVLMFMYIICNELSGGDEYLREQLYKSQEIYLNSLENADKFLNSLIFFGEHQRTIGYYFAIHFAVFKKFSVWDMTNGNVMGCELENNVLSFGFFKKIKYNELLYIFNGKIYEFIKNKKEHDIANKFDKADETQVPELRFNGITTFYITEDGVFDVCTKTYRETCPFIAISALKKNYISRSNQIVPKPVFVTMFNALRNDLMLLRVYHARKVELQFNTLYANIKDCALAGPRLTSKKIALLESLDTLIKWLLKADATMLVLLMMKLQLNEHLHNIILEGQPLDIMTLQLAIACQFLWPKAAITGYVWALIKSHGFFNLCFQEYVMQANDIFVGLDEKKYYINRKIIVESLHDLVKNNVVTLVDVHDIDSYMKKHIEDINLGVEQKNYENWRYIDKINTIYSKYRRLPLKFPVWTDKLIEYHENDDMYTWLTRFYKRIYLNKFIVDMNSEQENLLTNFVLGFCYFRVLTNFNPDSSKAIMHFCASLAIPSDYEKMCLNITSEPNCGKSSLFELLDKLVLVYKNDRRVYELNCDSNSSKIKRMESQLYIMNETEIMSKSFLKSVADSTKFELANKKYCPEEFYFANYKVMITNNEMLHIRDGYDKACSNRIGLIYLDHSFESDIDLFDGSVYECYERKRYPEIKDINMKLMSPVKQLLANVLVYNSDPKTGYVFYKSILKKDKCYRHNKKCLSIYNDPLEALLYVLDVKELKFTPETGIVAQFTENTLIDMITKSVELVKYMVYYKLRENVNVNDLLSRFRKKYGRGKFYNSETNTFENLSIATSERRLRSVRPRLKSSVDNYMMS